jgi:Uma2 family endonuclease
MAVPERRMTLEEFLELPEETPALEFEDGVATQKVPPQGQHAGLQGDILELINRVVRPAKLARAFPELRSTYGGRSRVPDIAVYRWDRVPVAPDGRIANDFREPPDMAIEIVSPGQGVNQLVARCASFVEQGARAALVVDPDHESVIEVRPGAIPIERHRGATIDLDDILPGLTLSVSEIFDGLIHR